MTHRKSRVRRLGLIDLGLTAIAFMIAAVVELGLRTVRLPRLAQFLGTPLATAESSATPIEKAAFPSWARRRLAAARRALRHWPFDDTCLRVALVGGCLLRSLDPQLRIGVARQDGEIRAHAWIEVGGRSLDPGSRDFATVGRARLI